ncbi:MAG: hypothetical protein FVQ83_03550 [Chloroflexi bacterium]|nr:hypothetical protein [Chloroflexota bacterium]
MTKENIRLISSYLDKIDSHGLKLVLALLVLATLACMATQGNAVEETDEPSEQSESSVVTEPTPGETEISIDDPTEETSTGISSTPEEEQVIFNRRATGSGTAWVDGEPYSFEIFLCGWGVSWSDEAYPQDSDETAFYGDDPGQDRQFTVLGAGLQDDEALFHIGLDLSYSSGLADVSFTRLDKSDSALSWEIGSGLLSPDRFALNDGNITTPRPIRIPSQDDVLILVEIAVDATCVTYGGTFDTERELLAEAIGMPLPDPGLGAFVLDGQSYQINPEICAASQEYSAAEIEGEGEQDGESYTLSLRMSDGFSLLSVTFSDPYRRLDLEDITDTSLIIEGTRVYSSAPFELRESTNLDFPVHTFSLDITCP